MEAKGHTNPYQLCGTRSIGHGNVVKFADYQNNKYLHLTMKCQAIRSSARGHNPERADDSVFRDHLSQADVFP
ncbi:MAG: hypothetical protein LBB76_11410 [Azoarcus sp.]|jgi:hypothetical protein|nr:hypothetical protein [Azoarcus sp.]